MTLDYIQAEQGGVCFAANSSCHTYINTSLEVETSIDKITQQATWVQQTLDCHPLFQGGSKWFRNL